MFEIQTSGNGLSTVEFLNIPSWPKIIEIHYYNVLHGGASLTPRVAIGNSTGYLTSSGFYVGQTYNQTGAVTITHDTNIPIFHTAYSGASEVRAGFIRFHKLATYTVSTFTYRPFTVEGNAVSGAGAACQIVGGNTPSVLGSDYNRIRVTTGTAALFGANMYAVLRYY